MSSTTKSRSGGHENKLEQIVRLLGNLNTEMQCGEYDYIQLEFSHNGKGNIVYYEDDGPDMGTSIYMFKSIEELETYLTAKPAKRAKLSASC